MGAVEGDAGRVQVETTGIGVFTGNDYTYGIGIHRRIEDLLMTFQFCYQFFQWREHIYFYINQQG
ncbi:hypothetical protein Barb6_03625 [Bacteroidales bacterium Barb6]|nr:hypothetical protein Barb6_03625 [Bacteroidales bacterium Barb6]